MKLLARAGTSLLVVAVFSTTLFAQWPSYPTAGVPKLPDGKPNLMAPAPRTGDGHPDLTGLWEYTPLPRPATPAPAASSNTKQPALDATNRPAGDGTSQGLGPAPRGPNQFFDFGSTIKGGLPYTQWASDLRKQRIAANNKDNPDAHCLPIGLTQLHMHPQPRKIVQTPAEIVIVYEAQSGVRQIFTDGRKLPNNDPQPWWYGYSVGHWEGDTLVVETNGFRDDVWLDVQGSPLTGTGKMTERITRPNFGNLSIDITVEDPKSYSKPFTVNVKQHILLDSDLIEFICGENERDETHLVDK